jgi:hypothetical protein
MSVATLMSPTPFSSSRKSSAVSPSSDPAGTTSKRPAKNKQMVHKGHKNTYNYRSKVTAKSLDQHIRYICLKPIITVNSTPR